MPVNAALYTITASNEWRKKADSSAERGDNLLNHAERALLEANLTNLGGKPGLIVQNAYPCTGKGNKTGCHQYFIEKSRGGLNIILKVTGDQGGYGAEHGFTQGKAPVPAIIYYSAGTSQIITMTSANKTPPAVFATVPNFDYIAL
ncbi:hypothetical protein [Azospirillum canadense]|uniref:hypothetical protein n=1 Tax=Azospirillum canadense TaxID=403962 RepID=UPI0022271194|nr:hypothetical protein [Azospirillum canadense]MCW2237917.1 hypothetical protein [Azospirillum canadense]